MLLAGKRYTMRVLAALAACLCVWGPSGRASAQAPPERPDTPAEAGQAEPPAPAPIPSPRPARRAVAPTLSAAVGGPLVLSGSAGLIIGRDRAAEDECPSPRGWLVQGEAGIGGGKLSAGPVFTYCYTPLGSLGAASLQAAFVRTWGRPLATEQDLSYLGGELDVGLIDWKVSLGLLKRVRGDRGAGWLFTWGLGRGF